MRWEIGELLATYSVLSKFSIQTAVQRFLEPLPDILDLPLMNDQLALAHRMSAKAFQIFRNTDLGLGLIAVNPQPVI